MSDELLVCVIILIAAIFLVISQLIMFLMIYLEGKDDKGQGRDE